MLEIGNWNELEVTRIIEAGLYLDGGEREVFLPHHRIPDGVEVGDSLKVMIYLDSKAQPVATTMPPIAVVGQFARLKANDAGEHGAFLDWGIEKDLLLPESEQVKPVSRGDDSVVYIMLDPRNGKPIATARIERHLSDDTHQLEHNQQVELMIYSRTDLGYKVLIDRTWPGLLYFDQSDERLRYGDIRPGYIARVRPDGKVDVSLRPMGKEAQLEGMDILINALEAAGGYLPFHDKTPPDEIKQNFGMSKKQFKKAIGGLYKQGKITLEPDGIRLSYQA